MKARGAQQEDLLGKVSLFKNEGESGGAEKDSSQGAED